MIIKLYLEMPIFLEIFVWNVKIHENNKSEQNEKIGGNSRASCCFMLDHHGGASITIIGNILNLIIWLEIIFQK
jgi:hypothetical protein